MLDSFYIRNFRLFQELSIENLGQVNLIVGKNNSGKSCLLEALYLYARRASQFALRELIRNRGEDWEARKTFQGDRLIDMETSYRHLFYGYHLPEIGKSSIEIGPLENEKEHIKIHLCAYQYINESGILKVQKIYADQLQDREIDITDLGLECEEYDKSQPLMILGKNIENPTIKVLDASKNKYNVQYISTKKLDSYSASNLWDRVNIQPSLRQEVFKAVKLIDQDIQEVVKFSFGVDIVFILIYSEEEKTLTLSSMGDGMTHLFYIILALVNAKDGILLIDEFENGLHYEVQPKLWELILKLSERLNVQVFATTHSRDTIYALRQATSSLKREERTRFLKLKRSPKTDAVKVVERVPT